MERSTPSPTPAVAPVSVHRFNNTDTITTLMHAIGVNGALLLVGILLFNLIWNLEAFRSVTRSRLYVADDDDRTTPPPPDSKWLTRILWLRGEDLIEVVGLDAYFYLRFLRFAIVYFGILTAIFCPILIPYNMSAAQVQARDQTRPLDAFHFTELTIGNIRNSSGALWLHIVFAYLQAALLIVLLARECQRYAAASARHHLGVTLTLQVECLPVDLRKDAAFARFVRDVAADDAVVRARVVRTPKGAASQVGFVTLESVGAAARLMSAISVRRPQVRAMRAPLPDDLIWENVVWPRRAVLARRSASALLVCVVIAFWTVPMTAIASLELLLPSFASAWQPLLEGVLPAWSFLLLLTLTPRVLARLSQHEVHATHSARHVSVFEKFTWVLFFDFFLFGILSRGLIQTLVKTAAHLSYLQEAIAATIPEQSTSVIIYLLSFTCITLPLVDLNQILATIVFLFKRFESPGTLPLFSYGEYYSYQVLHILMGYTYATIAPLMLPFVLLYFVISAGVSKIQFCYVYGRREGCATLYPIVVGRTIGTAMAGCAILMSIMISKSATVQALSLAPILVVLPFAHFQLRKQCQRPPNIEVEAAFNDGSEYRPPWQNKTKLRSSHSV